MRIIVKGKARKHPQCHLFYLLMVSHLLHVKATRPVEVAAWKQEERGEGFLSSGLCLRSLPSPSKDRSPEKPSFVPSLSSSPSFLHGVIYFHTVCLEFMSLSIRNANEEQDPQGTCAQTLKTRQPTSVSWADLLQKQKFKGMADMSL